MGFAVQASGPVTTDRFVKNNYELARRAVRSIVESIHLLKTNPDLSKRSIRKYMRVKDDRDTGEAYQIMRDVLPRKPYPTVEGVKASSMSSVRSCRRRKRPQRANH